MGEAVLLLDREGRVLAFNHAAARINRGIAILAPGVRLEDIWPRAAGEPLQARFQAAMARRIGVATVYQSHDESGRAVSIELHALPVAQGLVVAVRDAAAVRRGELVLRQSEARATRLQALTAALSAAVDQRAVAAAIIAQALPALDAQAGNVYLLDDDGRVLTSIAAAGYDAATLERSRHLPHDSPTLMADVVCAGQAIVLGNWAERVARYPHHQHLHPPGSAGAVAGLPLTIEDRTIGALSLAFPTDRRIDADERRFMDTIAGLCAQALDRARLHETVRHREQQFRQLADTMPQIAWVSSGDGVTLEFLNQRWFAYTGQSPALDTAVDANGPTHPDDRALERKRWREAVRTGRPYECELRLRRADGSYRWFLSRGVPVRDATGKTVRWFGTSTDIDDAKRGEASQRFLAELGQVLAASLDPEETLRRVVRLAVPVLADYSIVDVRDATGNLRRVAWAHVDPAEQRTFDAALAGWVPQRLHEEHPISRTLHTGEAQFVPKVTTEWLERIAFSPDHLEFMRQRQFISQITVPLRARDRTLGAITFCCTVASGRRFQEGDLHLAQDVAERVALVVDNARLFKETREAEAKIRRLLDAGVIGVLVATPDLIVEANDTFLAMIGSSRDALAAGEIRWPEMTPPEYAELDARAIAELAERGVCTPFEKEYIRGDGSRVPVMIGAATVEEDPPRWISFVLDLTERKRAEDEWRTFIDATAHDLRNPLTAILGQSQIIQRRLQRHGEEAVGDVEARAASIAGAAERAAGLIDDLIDTARMRAKQPLELQVAPVDLIALVSRCAAESHRAAPSHSVRIGADRSSLVAAADGARIERVLRNVFDNAVKYSPDGTAIEVRVRREQEREAAWAVIAIEDHGIGIPAADQARVFDQFHRGGNVAGKVAGSGIGLSGARQIVEQHGGTIELTSTEGVGSTFTIRLPLAARDG